MDISKKLLKMNRLKRYRLNFVVTSVSAISVPAKICIKAVRIDKY